MKIDNNLSEVFDMNPIEGEVITKNNNVIVPEQNSQNETVDYDYNKSRNNLHSLLSQGQEALAYALDVAKQSEHPRAFEVVGNLVKQLADVNQQLLDIHQQHQKLTGVEKKESEVKTVTNNNAIFVGSTSELNKLIHNMNKGE